MTFVEDGMRGGGQVDVARVAAASTSDVKFVGVTSPRGELLRSPVSGVPCVHWRLRIVEQVNGTLQLVHELASIEDFDVTWSGTGQGSASLAAYGGTGLGAGGVGPGAVKIRVVPQSARIEATPVLHRPGSPGALLAGRQFGFLGQLSVEEVTLRAGEEICAEGILEEPSWGCFGGAGASAGAGAGAAGPFRGVERELELLDATVRLPTRATLAPVLLPWALGTAAALLGGVGVAAWAARRFELLPDLQHGTVTPAAEIGPVIHRHQHPRRLFSRPD